MVAFASENTRVREALEYLLSLQMGKWWTPRMLQAYVWGCGKRISFGETVKIMDSIVEDYADDPHFKYERDIRGRYRVTCYFLTKNQIVT